MIASADAIAADRHDDQRARTLALSFAGLVVLTIAEVLVAGLARDRAACVTTLCGLLMAKAGLVLAVFLRVRLRRRDPRLALGALILAAGIAVVLMLEMAFRMRQR
jgi:cytochrome c oxidase subunit IV